jgi:hypothetical protein
VEAGILLSLSFPTHSATYAEWMGHPASVCLIPFEKNHSSPKQLRGTRVRSPELLPFGWRYRYFFFAAFFAAFFAGAFLAAFLVAICLFSLVTIFVSQLQTILQMKNV